MEVIAIVGRAPANDKAVSGGLYLEKLGQCRSAPKQPLTGSIVTDEASLALLAPGIGTTTALQTLAKPQATSVGSRRHHKSVRNVYFTLIAQ